MRFASFAVATLVAGVLAGCGDAASDHPDGSVGDGFAEAGGSPSAGASGGAFAPAPIIAPPRRDAGMDASVDSGPAAMDASSEDDGTVPEPDSGGVDASNPCGNGVLDVGEACDTVLDACCNATCDGARGSGSVCRPQQGDCDVEEQCDGTSFACPIDGMEPGPGTVLCRAAGPDPCDLPDFCTGASKTCPDAVASSAIKCADTSGDPCDLDDYCNGTAKTCPEIVKSAATPCGNLAADVCDLDDACDGVSKTCPDVVKASDVVCRAAGAACDADEYCSGTGPACPPDVLALMGTPCGLSLDDLCDNPDTCDSLGNCQLNYEPANTACGDVGVACHVVDRCDGGGICVDNLFETMGTPCGSNATTECTNPDSCDNAGNCMPNDEPLDWPCGDTGIDCHYDDKCNGSGTCVNNGTWPMGMACGSGTDTECDNPDTCNAAGNCQPNYVLATTPCGRLANQCVSGDECDGVGSCLDQGFWADGVPCDLPSPDAQGMAFCSTGLCCPGATTNNGAGCGLPPGDNLVFLSSGPVPNGAFGATWYGDAHCEMLAGAANLRGTWHAWLSDTTEDAIDRVSDGPYRRVDGPVIAPDVAGLTDGMLTVPIEIVELNLQSVSPVYTGTYPSGRASQWRCGDWANVATVADAGTSNQVDSRWTTASLQACGNPARLYCFQDDCPGQPAVDFMNDPQNCGACANPCPGTCVFGQCQGLAFVTSTPYDGTLLGAIAGGGLADADQICNAAAQAVTPKLLPGTYRAWLSTDSVDAWTRILDQPYLRVDGLVVASSLPQLLGSALETPLMITEQGTITPAPAVWTGTNDDGTLGGPSPCSNWTAASGNASAGAIGATGPGWSNAGLAPCATQYPIFCFQTGPVVP